MRTCQLIPGGNRRNIDRIELRGTQIFAAQSPAIETQRKDFEVAQPDKTEVEDKLRYELRMLVEQSGRAEIEGKHRQAGDEPGQTWTKLSNHHSDVQRAETRKHKRSDKPFAVGYTARHHTTLFVSSC